MKVVEEKRRLWYAPLPTFNSSDEPYSPEGFYPVYHLISYGKPFDRRDFFENLSYYVEHNWGSYNELIELTMKDFIEIRIGLESKANREKLENSLSNM